MEERETWQGRHGWQQMAKHHQPATIHQLSKTRGTQQMHNVPVIVELGRHVYQHQYLIQQMKRNQPWMKMMKTM
jgi:hypothetical protein